MSLLLIALVVSTVPFQRFHIVRLILQSKIDRDVQHDPRRNVVEISRLILPLASRLHGGLDQQWMAGDELEIGNLSLLREHGFKNYGACDPCGLSQQRIDRLNSLDKPRRLYLAADLNWDCNDFGCFGPRRRRRRWCYRGSRS